MEMFTLSKKELELMELLWEEGYPMSRSEILGIAVQRPCSWKPVSIHVLLNHLMELGAVQVSGYYLNSRKLGRRFEAAVTRKDYSIMQIKIALQEAQALTGASQEEILSEASLRVWGRSA